MTKIKHQGSSLDDPLEAAIAKANEAIRAGFTVYQKFTCAGCGQRLTIEEPNTFHRAGTCDRCPALTNIERTGCGFLAVTQLGHPKPKGPKGDPNAT
jgi:hypothetical protein